MAEIPQKPAEASESPPIASDEASQLRPKSLDVPEPKRRLPPIGKQEWGRRAREPQGLPSAMTSVAVRSLKDALAVTDQEVLAYLPSEDDVQVGEALVSGASTVVGIQGYCGLSKERIKAVMNNAVAMAWISRRVEALFTSRVAVVDAAVYLRAAGGDVTAAKLFYERFKVLQANTMRIEHNYSGGVNISALPDDELARIVLEKGRMLPKEFRILDVVAETDSSSVPQGAP